MRIICSLTAIAIAASLVVSAARASEPGVLARTGDVLTSDIAPGDTDAFALRLGEGGPLTVKLKTAKGDGLLPRFRLFRPDGQEENVLSFVKKAGTTKPQLKKFVPAPGQTGTWVLQVLQSDSGSGGYTASFAIALPAKVKEKGIVVGAGETVRVEFTADDGALLTAKVKEKAGGPLAGVRIVDPDGEEIAGSADAFARKKTTLSVKKSPLTGRFGRYAVELTGDPGSATTVDVVLAVKHAKTARRKETLPPEVELIEVLPEAVRQEDSSRVVQLRGSGFLSGDGLGALVGGEGVTVSAVSVLGADRVNVTLDVAGDAPFGARALTYFPPPLVGEPVTLADALTIHAPDPTVSGFSLASVTQGDTGVTLDVTGTGFRDGGAISISGEGLTVTRTEVLSPTLARATLDVDLEAEGTLRDVRFAQPEAGGGAVATAAGKLRVFFPAPSLTDVAPDVLRQGDSGVTLTLSGSAFRSGAQVSTGTGITLSNPLRISDAQFRVTATVSSSATLGARDVTYTQPSTGGGLAATLVDAFVVEAPVPTIASVSPTFLSQGDGPTTVTVDGGGFRDGGVLSFSGDGLTVGATTFVSETRATVTIAVSGAAEVGLRDVTFTQAAAKGGASGIGIGALAIHAPPPTLVSISPTEVEQGETGTLTLTGTNFTPGGVVTSSGGTGLALSSPTYVSPTSFTVAYDVSGSATVSLRDITFTQSQAAGGAAATLTDALDVLDAGVILTDVSPAVAIPGAGRSTLVLTGDEYNTGTTVAFSGGGITVHSTTVDSTTQITLVVSVASGSTISARDVTITPGPLGLPAATFSNRFAVAPGDPTVTAFSAPALPRGASNVAVTVTGTNFRSGDGLSASGTGLTFSSVVIVDAETITALAAVTSGATLGSRDITVAHATSIGGRAATLAAAVEVVGTSPTITSINPSALGRTGSGGPTRQIPVTITGTGFTSGATLSLSKSGGSGLSLVSGTFTVISSTTASATLQVTGTTTTGLWDAQVALPSSLGNTGTSGNGALDVKSETTLAVHRVAESTGTTFGGERVTIYGSGFTTGAVVDFGTVRAPATQVIDGNTIVTTVPTPSSSSTSAATSVNVKVTNPNGGNATFTSGYTYARDTTRMVITQTFPAQGATGVPTSLKSVCVLLSAPCDTTTAPHGSTGGTNAYYFESGSFIQSTSRGFGPQKRWLVLTRSSTSALTSSAGHVMDIPTALKSIGGTNMTPTRLAASGSRDQYSFTTGTSSDTSAPTVTITPSTASTGRSTTTDVVLAFNEEIDPLTVTSTNITFKQGSTTIAAAIEISDDLRTVTITPEAELATSTTYTTTVTSSVKDLSGNAFSQTAYTFTTGNGTDSTAPTIDSVVLEDLPADMDGSGTWVNASGTSGQAYDAYLPRSGWMVEVRYSDQGGAGIDESTFSAKASVAVGGNSASAELASNFTITSTRAYWRIPSGTNFATGNNITFTFRISDAAATANAATASVVTVDIQNKDSTVSASAGGDHDPFDTRQTWILRDDLDAYTSTIQSQTSPTAQRGVTTTTSSDGIADLDEALRLVGLGSTSMTTAAAGTVNGVSRGTNAIVKRLFMERTREVLRERWHIDEDGTRDADSMDVEFLLNGEQGALSTQPTNSTSNSSNSSKAFSEMSLGGTLGQDTSSFTSFSTLGQAWYDTRNRRQEANLNLPSSSITGIYLTGAFENNLNGSSGTSFRALVTDVFVSEYGGTAVGESASDDDVLAGTFDRTTSTNTTHNTRYDAIMDAIDFLARFTSATAAHEIGHSTGLVEDGAPKTGLFGAAHYNNTFTEATSTSTNTTHHLDYVGQDLMAPASSISEDTATGTDFARFNPMLRAWLRARLIHDEGL